MDALISGLLRDAVGVASAVAERYGPLLATAALKGSLLLGAAALATRAMRRASAASRHLVWSATVAAVLALPLIEAAGGPRWNLPIVPASVRALLPAPSVLVSAPLPASEPAVSGMPAPVVVTISPVAGVSVTELPAPAVAIAVPGTPVALATAPALAPADVAVPVAVAVAPARGPSPLGWAMLVWAAGAAVVLLRLALGTVGLSRLVRRARPADDPSWVMLAQRLARELGIRRPVTLLVGRTGTVPVTWGVVYPIVLLPADADEWAEERRRAVLLHELAHVERFDAFTHVLSQLALAVFWFNPLVSLAARRLRAERERACDDVVLAVGTRPADYAGDLLELVQTLGEASPAAAALAMARRSEFEGRLLAILDPAVPRSRTSRRATLGATVGALLAVVPLAAMRPAPAAGEGGPVVVADAAALALPGNVAMPGAEALDTTRGARRDSVQTWDVDTALMTAWRSGRPDSALAAQPFSPMRDSLAVLAVRLADVSHGIAARRDSLAGTTRALAAPSADGCSPIRGRYFVADDAPGRTFRVVDDDHCVEVHAVGVVEFTEDYGDVRAIAPDARLVVTETRDGVTRRMTFADSSRRFTVGGVERPVAEGAAWLRRALAGSIRDAGFDIDVRVDRLRRDGGVPAVLAAAMRQSSESVKRRYLDALIASAPRLTDAELRDVAVTASRVFVGDGDKSAVLRAASRRGGASATVGAAVVGGVSTIVSDGDKRRVLEQATQPPQATVAVLTLAAQSTKGIVSDGDKAAVLKLLAPRVSESAALRSAFFGSVDGMTSSGERRGVLQEVLRTAADDSTIGAVLASSRGILTESDRVPVLAAVAPMRAAGTPWVRDLYFRAVSGLVSEGQREAALTAIVRARPGDLDVANATVAAAASMTSDHAKANVLLEVATRTPILKDEAGRAALFNSLKSLSSGAEYRRVMEAVIR